MKALIEFSITAVDGSKGTISCQGNLKMTEATKLKEDFRVVDIRSIDGMQIKFN